MSTATEAPSSHSKVFEKDTACPAPDQGTACDVKGSLPGIKRHFLKKHSELDFGKAFPEAPKPVKEAKPKAEKPATAPKPTAEKPSAAPPKSAVSPDTGVAKPLAEMSTAELRGLAKGKGVEGWHKMGKDQLIAALNK